MGRRRWSMVFRCIFLRGCALRYVVWNFFFFFPPLFSTAFLVSNICRAVSFQGGVVWGLVIYWLAFDAHHTQVLLHFSTEGPFFFPLLKCWYMPPLRGGAFLGDSKAAYWITVAWIYEYCRMCNGKISIVPRDVPIY